jgi:putative methyltransferase (TIGR04325 family)
MSRYREIAKLLVPSIAVAAIRRLQGGGPSTRAAPEWEYVADNWPDNDPRAAGWLHDSIVAAQLKKWTDFERSVRTPRPLGVAHEAQNLSFQDYSAHNTIMCFAYVLARAAHNCDTISILDWGGGLGHYPLIARAILPEVALEYVIHDLPNLCAAGRELCPGVTFSSEERTTFAQRYYLVFASSSLQYAQHWRTQMTMLARASERWLYLTRLPTVSSAPSFVAVQRPGLYGYNTEYIGWVLNRDELYMHARSCNLILEREFLVDERPVIAGAPEQCEYRGLLFRLEGAASSVS